MHVSCCIIVVGVVFPVSLRREQELHHGWEHIPKRGRHGRSERSQYPSIRKGLFATIGRFHPKGNGTFAKRLGEASIGDGGYWHVIWGAALKTFRGHMEERCKEPLSCWQDHQLDGCKCQQATRHHCLDAQRCVG